MRQIHKGPRSEFAIVSLTLGLMCFINLAGIEKALAAIVFGILALKRIAAPQSNERGEGLAAAGIVLGIISAVLIGIFLFALIKNPALIEQILKRPLPQ